MNKYFLPIVHLKITLISIFLFLSLIGTSQSKEETIQKEAEETQSNPSSSEEIIELDKILVMGERAYSTASSRSIRVFDLNTRPVNTAQDMEISRPRGQFNFVQKIQLIKIS